MCGIVGKAWSEVHCQPNNDCKGFGGGGESQIGEGTEDKLVLIDKSNIFRALTIFRKHHLVHTIEDGNGGIRYELCMSHSSVDDDDEHVHFFCEKCGKTFCLNSTPVPAVQLPEGYVHRSSNFLVKGLCPACAGKHGTPSL